MNTQRIKMTSKRRCYVVMVVMCFFALNIVAQTYSQIYDDDFYKRLYPDIANAYGRSNAYSHCVTYRMI